MQPRPHQIEALEAIRSIGPSGRALAVLACGTGKTLIGRMAALERAGDDGRVMLLVPSKELLRQTYEDWQRDVPGGVDGLLVFSDPSVGEANATTDSDKIATFLRTETGRIRLLLCTYQSAARVAEAYEADVDLPPLDVMVLDEAHRTAGPGGHAYALVLDDNRIPATTRIALTATAKVHPAGDGTQDVVSMDDPSLYGERVYELTFGAAIQKKLLSDFRVAVVLVADEEVHQVLLEQTSLPRGDELTTSQVAAQIAVARAVEEYGLRRIIAFHGRRERSRVFTNTLGSTASTVTRVPIEALHVDGTSNPSERRAVLAKLANPDEGGATVLSNIQVLTEGVDVPSVDSVVFADPKTSKIAIAQAVGRALRLHPGKDKPSVIVLPVYLAPGESPETVLEGSDFRHVWAVLSSLRDFDERMDSSFSQARMEFGEQEFTGQDRSVSLPSAIEILGEDGVLQSKLHEALKLHILTNTTESWLDRYGKLKAYLEFTGDVPKNSYVTPQGDALGSFAASQKTNYKKGVLLPSRAELLEKLPGWNWGKRQERYPEIDEPALMELVDEFNNVLRDHSVESELRSMRMIKLAYRCERLVPEFKWPPSKYRAFVNNAVGTMHGLWNRTKDHPNSLYHQTVKGEELAAEFRKVAEEGDPSTRRERMADIARSFEEIFPHFKVSEYRHDPWFLEEAERMKAHFRQQEQRTP
ncbi:DEAD/DEAH box helicase [Streptomyces sp. H27-C3]|uniref:DEAD/DEAH box helicase n=1 Tax=Streptomyces sp. H27-C3 TaxID=3046305 RepID=UPI0024BA086A|nr:DEAD/DEAH box helicase [Streptomyces sp. H27-C3]MDJ0463069.1 DEAD/DEAH box helicase family protein [Streptomyces sp. H27-C3]